MPRATAALRTIITLLTVLLSGQVAQAQLQFQFIHPNDISPQALAGFEQAAARWSHFLNNDITITLNVDFAELPAGVLGGTNTHQRAYGYADVRAALAAQPHLSADDLSAISHLQPGPTFQMLINGTANDPYGSDYPDNLLPYIDNNGGLNNQVLYLSDANAKALGLLAPDFVDTPDPANYIDFSGDASIVFTSDLPWDFNPDGPVDPGTYDFVGAATHEIGHALGFLSGVDDLDVADLFHLYGDPLPTDDGLPYVSTLDLFRYSQDSLSLGGPGVPDWTIGDRGQYFSIDGGQTALAPFSTGLFFGDGYQASHWKQGDGIGLMDPALQTGVRMSLSPTDLRAFDVIGYNVVPEPGAPLALGVGSLGLACFAFAARYRPAYR